MSMAPMDEMPTESKDVSLAPPRPPTTNQASGPSEDVNLVKSLTEKEQQTAVDAVIRDYDSDVESRRPRMMRLKEFQGLYASVMKAKTFPFRNAANINMPVLATPWLQLQGRLVDMIWPSTDKIIVSTATNSADVARANACELFGNAYLRHKMPEMPQGIDDTLHQVVGYGSAFRRTYWNGYEGRVCSDFIPIEDFVVAYGQRSQDPSLRDVPRYTFVNHLTYYDIESYGAQGIYANTDKVKADKVDEEDKTEFGKQLEKIDGSTNSSDTTPEDQPRMVLEQHRIWRMPNAPNVHPAFDGKPHPVVITVDEQSKALLRFVVREEPDPDDAQRFQKEKAAYDAHIQQLTAFMDQTKAAHVAQAALAQTGEMLPPEMMPPPMPPAPPPGVQVDESGMPIEPKPQRMRELCFFTHYRAFPSEGFYGLGLGDFCAGINKAVNTILNQHIDGGTLRNSMPGFISAQLKGQRGTVNIQPGELIEVDAPMGSIEDGMYFPQFPPPDPSTMRIAQMLLEASDKMVAASDLMSGQTSGANRTAKETQILAEQMMMQITVLAGRIKRAFKHEIDKIWRCWGVFLSDDEIMEVIGPDGDPQTVRVGKAMFIPNAHVMPAADPRTKAQRLDDSMRLFGLISQNPYLMNQPPPVKDALMRAVTEEVLRAHSADRFVKLLPPPPGPPPPPPPPQPYWQENANFLRGQDQQVNPQDNDLEHIQGHQMHLQSPAGQMMDKAGRDMLEHHVRFHIAANIEKTGQQQMQQQQLAQQMMAQAHGVPPMMPQMMGAPQ